MLNACIPQPVGHLFADYIGLLCTKKVTRSLLRPSREAASATSPCCPSIAVVFLRPVSDPAVSKDIHPKVDALPSSHHFRVLVSSPCQPCYCFVCFLREKSQGASAGTKDFWYQITPEMVFSLSLLTTVIRTKVHKHCQTRPDSDWLHLCRQRQEFLTRDTPKLRQVILPAQPALRDSYSFTHLQYLKTLPRVQLHLTQICTEQRLRPLEGIQAAEGPAQFLRGGMYLPREVHFLCGRDITFNSRFQVLLTSKALRDPSDHSTDHCQTAVPGLLYIYLRLELLVKD